MGCSLPDSSVRGIFQQEYCSGLPFPSLEDLPDPGIKPTFPVSPALAGRFFITEAPRMQMEKLLLCIKVICARREL